MAKRQALIVLGMHRSGTSALSGVLSKLGAREPKTIMPPTADNPRGYFESTEFMGLHDQILASGGSAWDDWERFNPEWFGSSTEEEFRERLPVLIEREYGKARLLLLKDPRICRFFPFWLRALDELGIVPKVVFPLRHPLEVVQSLRARAQFGRGRGQLLWLRHVLDAEYASREVKRCFMRYTDLLDDWRRETARLSLGLGIKWPRMSGAVEIEIDEFLGSELRHQVADRSALDETGELASWVRSAVQALEQLVDGNGGDEAEPRRVLDGIRAEFDRTAAIYGSVVREQVAQSEHKADHLSHALDARTQEVAGLSTRLEAAERAHKAEAGVVAAQEKRLQNVTERLAVQVATHVQVLTEMQARQTGSELTMQSLREKLSVQADELAARESDCAALKRAETELAAHLSSRQAELDERVRTEALLRKDLQEMGARIREKDVFATGQSSRIRVLETGSLKFQQQLDDRFDEIARLTRRVFVLEDNIVNMSAEHRAAVAVSQAAIASKDAEIQLLQERLDGIVGSTSWAMTRPMRTVSGWFRRDPVPTAGSQYVAAAQRLRQSGRFDEKWYLERYPDVRENKMDPVMHYLHHGADEDRDPSPDFSTAEYRARNPGLAQTGINPLLHSLGQDDTGTTD